MTMLHRLSVGWLLSGWCLLTGCGRPTLPATEPLANKSQPSPAPAEKNDWTVPRLAPHPLVWIDDWNEGPELPAERVAAKTSVRIADRLKASGQYSEAATAYQTASTADPTWPYPHYQAACNYELWGQHDNAVAELQNALALGFKDFPIMVDDDELGRLRSRPEFVSQLKKVRELYLSGASELVGQPIAVRPEGTPPPAGWPVMLLLHGYGDTNLNYLDQADQWAGEGFVTVAVPGSVPAGDGFQWPDESAETTHEDLQAILNSPLLQGVIDREQVYLLGFSQGALHSLVLTAQHPQQYAGVVTMSPGGSFASQLATPNLNRTGRPAKIYFLHGDAEPHAPVAKIWERACQDAGWKFQSTTHPGGHHFPSDWEEQVPKIAQFLKS